MTSITNSLNSGLSSYYNTGLTEQTGSTSSSDSDTRVSAEGSVATGDTVSLSPAVKTAQTREYLGLNPTGTLTLSDIQGAAAQQEEAVGSMLATAMEALGINENQQISLSLDDDGKIEIAESFASSDELEEALNSDDTFVQAFSGLSVNNEIMDYATSLQSKSTSLVDYINGDTSDSDMFSLASRYSSIKSASSPIESLWQVSHDETPFTYVANEIE
ncbi:MAG: hypothetical protein QM498_02355 [Desulfobacterium sp.]